MDSVKFPFADVEGDDASRAGRPDPPCADGIIGRAGRLAPPLPAARPEAVPYQAARPEAAPYHLSPILDPPCADDGASGGRALPVRKSLSHVPPFRVDASNAAYFITICAADRTNANWVGRGVLDPPPPASVIIEAAKHYHALRKWFMHLILVMPDHLHAIVTFYERRVETPRPTERRVRRPRPTMVATLAQWKSFVAKNAGIRFQRDFWDTRIRNAVHFAEQLDYIKNNPVRKNLVTLPEEWLWQWQGE
jgi:REP element-mobilizing transposase RayT